MEYVTYRHFRGEGIGGRFNLKYGTVVKETDGYLFALDGRLICAVTSENGWEHFRPNTPDGAHRQKMLDRLCAYYKKHGVDDTLAPAQITADTNLYWKSLLRTKDTASLERLFCKLFGTVPEREV